MDGRPKDTEGAKSRDADRSREALLRAASKAFAEEGFDAVSLAWIAASAGLSRGAPNYFYGSKEGLHAAVLERALAHRDEATALACRPLLDWAAAPSAPSLRGALEEAARGYLDFLSDHPDFARLIEREELSGGARLRSVPRDSVPMVQAFSAIREAGPAGGIGRFDVDDAVLVFVSLAFFPMAHRNTFMATLGRDPDEEAVRARLAHLVADQLLALLRAD